MVWEFDEILGIWVCSLRLGEMFLKGVLIVTGFFGGFWFCLWFIYERMDFFLINGKIGFWRMWVIKDNIICD